MPVVIHCRETARKSPGRSPASRGTCVVLHCFSDPFLCWSAVERGYCVSFAGNVTCPRRVSCAMSPEKISSQRLLARPTVRTSRRGDPRQAERAGQRHAHPRGPGRGARREAQVLARVIDENATARSACRDPPSFRRSARPALPGGREHRPGGRPPGGTLRDDVVLEVGPGLGVLTRLLADEASFVHAVEIDWSLEPHLRQLFATRKNVDVVFNDALDLACGRSAGTDEVRRQPAVQRRDPLSSPKASTACQPSSSGA